MTLEELEQIRSIQSEISGIRATIEEIEGLVLPAHEPSMGSSSSTPGNPTAAIVMSKITMEERLQAKIEQLVAKADAVEDWLDTVDDAKVRTIVRSRYLQNKPWEQVAKDSYLFAVPTTPYRYLQAYMKKRGGL